jgi:dolichyl-phosphate beta-glucosyltransferase
MKNISIVIPVFNEEKRIQSAFEALEELRLPLGLKLKEVIFVNDGSTDKTISILKNFKQNSSLPIKIVSYSKNKGKGNAVKLGMLKSKSDFALLCDADMSTPFSELKKFMPFVKNGEKVIIGTRKNGHSTVTIHQPKLRETLGKAFTLMTKTALRVPVTDFTCGFKMFSKEAIFPIFSNSKINGWGYDAEILFIAKQNNFHIQECAVSWADVKQSHVNIVKAVFKTLFELSQILFLHEFSPKIQNKTLFKTANFGKMAVRFTSLF